MDKSVPTGAAILLDFIYRTDAGKAPPACYQVIFANRQSKLAKPITKMTLDELLAAQKNWASKAWVKRNWGSPAASSASGAAQFMRNTLLGLKTEMKLTGKELFSADFQDRLAFHLLKRRGYAAFMAGKISRTEFGKRLAMEWASFPVLAAVKGAHRQLKRGQSYYAGDSLNKSLVSPDVVEALLDKVKATAKRSDGRPAPAAKTESEMPKEAIERVQQQLKDLGYTEVGGIDGKVGTLTATAIMAFRRENGLPDGDQIDDDLLLALQKAKPREIALARSEAAPEVVRDKVPEVRTNWLTKVGAFFTGIASLIAAAFNGILGNIEAASSYIQPVQSALWDVPGWVWLLLIAVVALGLFLVARHGEQKGVEAFQTGARR